MVSGGREGHGSPGEGRLGCEKGHHQGPLSFPMPAPPPALVDFKVAWGSKPPLPSHCLVSAGTGRESQAASKPDWSGPGQLSGPGPIS